MRDHGPSNGGRTRRQFLTVTGAAATTGLAGCVTLTVSGNGFDIGVTVVAFDPPAVTVEAGDEIVWRNMSSCGHTVTTYEGTLPKEAAFFISDGYETEQAARDAYSNSSGGLIGGGETYTHSFDMPGEYEYLYIPHEQADMVGTIIVEK